MYKDLILKKIPEYLKAVNWEYKKMGKMVMLKCIRCNKDPMSANVIPNTTTINCLSCKEKYNLIDVVRIVEPDKKEFSEEDILQYLKEKLNIQVETKKEEESLDDILSLYEKLGFDLVPVRKNAKIPAEMDWTNKSHKDKVEWKSWLDTSLNFGCKTGKISNIIVIDVDTKEVNPELKVLLDKNPTLMQITRKGFHYFYKYDPDFPKTRIDEFKTDIETDGGQVVIYPSVADNFKRELIVAPIVEMSPELKKLLQDKITIPRKTGSEKIREAIDTEKFKIRPEDFELKSNGLEGCCNSSFIKLGGVLRKELNGTQTEYVLQLLNQSLLERPMNRKTISVMVDELDKYRNVDEKELAHDILEHVREVNSITKSDLELSINGNWTKGEAKKRFNKALEYLAKEDKILLKGKNIELVKDLEWNSELFNIGIPVNFKVPYFHDYAHFNWQDVVVIASKSGYGKCHAKGTKILLASGSVKAVEDIKVEDKIQGINNNSRTVLKTYQGYGDLFEIQPKNNTPFIINLEHKLCLVHISTGKKIVISLKEYFKQHKTFKALHKLYRDTVDWEETHLEVDPYFLGLWLGDGDSRSIRITNVDKEVIKYLDNYAKELNLTLKEYQYGDRCPGWAIINPINTQNNRNNSLQAKLFKMNLKLNKHIPHKYKINSRENRLKLLAGVIDSDGYLDINGNFELSFKDKTLAEDVVFLSRSLGFSSKIHKSKALYNTIRYRFNIVGECKNIPTKIKRKKSTKGKSLQNPLRSGFKIKKLKKGNYYGFQLDGDHMYLLDNFIVNHNTHIAMNIVKRLVDQGIRPKYIYSETGGRFAKNALKLGMTPNNFDHARLGDPRKFRLAKNLKRPVIVYDWFRPHDWAKTDEIFEKLLEKIKRVDGFMILFMQLKDNDGYFAPNMLEQFPSWVCKYLYEDENKGIYTKFQITKIREPKIEQRFISIPCKYESSTKEVKLISELDEKEQKKRKDKK